jgi:FkbM family methyltransferase
MSILDGFRIYYSNLGVRGVFAISAFRLIGLPKEIAAKPPGLQHPVYLRVRTTDVSVYSSILLGKEYDFDLPMCPRTIVDAGANVGMASIYFAHKYPNAKIIAVEAEASNFAMLVRNVRAYPSIIPIHAALWNRDGEVSISQPEPFSEYGFFTREGSGVKVRAITMRSLMKEMRINDIDLLKVDIEGAEKEVFENSDWIRDVRCLMIELHDRFKPGCSEVVSSATREFSKFRRGETNVYVRHRLTPPH